jgi:RNA ligase (TIGR02306 family)
MDRKLASIQKITKLEPLTNSDNLEIATILGWHIVVRKSEFKEGDTVVYFEVDAFLPVRPEFEFLRERCFKKLYDGSEGFRIRTIKLRGQVSQGLIMPLSILAEPYIYGYAEGTDLTELLGVKKWEVLIPVHLAGLIKGSFPSFIPKTDEVRIQSVPNVLVRNKGTPVYITEKVDGTSATFYFRGGNFGVCSRNNEMKDDEQNVYWKVAKTLELEKRLSDVGFDIAVQGEILAPGIQKNRYLMKEPNLFVFSVFDLGKGIFHHTNNQLSFKEMQELCRLMGLATVPIVSDYDTLDYSVDELVELSKGRSLLNMNIEREGIVVRSVVEMNDEEIGRLSFKVINPNFLLKEE